MSSTEEMIEVFCPRCDTTYIHWESSVPGVLASSACPHCGHDPATDRLVFEDGIWSLAAEDEERAEG